MIKKLLFVGLLLILAMSCARHPRTSKGKKDPFRMDNLFPWSIVAYDSQKRNPEQRIQMIKELGFSQYAFGGNALHFRDTSIIDEWQLAKENHIKIISIWMWLKHDQDTAGHLNPFNEELFQSLKKFGLQTQIWVAFDKEYFEGLSDIEAFMKAQKIIFYLCKRAESLNCKIALYNHGGWLGQIKNQLAIIHSAPQFDIGIVYNFHHGHHDIERFPEIIKQIKPYLWAVNLNGMRKEGPKIIPIGQGNLEKEMIKTVLDAGFHGPFGILGHVKGGDAKTILQKNLNGLHLLKDVII